MSEEWPNQLPVVPGIEDAPQDPDLFAYDDDDDEEDYDREVADGDQ